MQKTRSLTPIHRIQGSALLSPMCNETVRVRGVVTGRSRKGYFVQDPEGAADPLCSDAIFVFSPRRKPPTGAEVEILGVVLDFVAGENARPTTQIKPLEVHLISKGGPEIEPVWLTADALAVDAQALARRLNGLEGMLVGIRAGAIFTAPSNPFGDYVCVPPDVPALRASNGGILVDPTQPNRWLPGFRITRYANAPCVNVGARLLTDVVGPLNYRAEAFQIVTTDRIEVEHVPDVHSRTRLEAEPDRVRILTLNGFNLDAWVEDPARVNDPDRDVDDDVLYGRFEGLAQAIVEQAGSPDIVALQEIQDNDGAEISDVVDASATYEQLQRDVLRLGGPAYDWADLPPEPGADGGQPGGNIRNAFLYDPARVELLRPRLRRIGVDAEAFDGSRKPLLAHFRLRATGAELVVVNVHLASKRHQRSLFAPEAPGYDPREASRVRQAEIVREALADARAPGLDFYITGDFNDFEFSPTLRALCADDCVNLVETLPPNARYDYNHRGQLQVLMHGVVPRGLAANARYEVLHGNEFNGMKPGTMDGKATDHAYVLVSLKLRGGTVGKARAR